LRVRERTTPKWESLLVLAAELSRLLDDLVHGNLSPDVLEWAAQVRAGTLA
jgi:hypothetical protein